MKTAPNSYELPEKMKHPGVRPMPEKPASLGGWALVMVLAGYACIGMCISEAMLGEWLQTS